MYGDIKTWIEKEIKKKKISNLVMDFNHFRLSFSSNGVKYENMYFQFATLNHRTPIPFFLPFSCQPTSLDSSEPQLEFDPIDINGVT